jgi:biotin carboxyl carrier protein
MPVALVKSINHMRLVQKRRKLAYPGDIFVKKGEKIKADTIVARTEMDTSAPMRVKVSAQLGIENDKIEDVLTVNVGDSVKKGDEIATFKEGVFSRRKSVESPYTGVIEYISKTRGEVMVRERLSEDESVIEVEIANKLNVSPFFMKTFMHVREGQDVTYNEILASIDGIASGAIRAPVRGKIERVDTKTGKVVIRRPYSPVNLYGYISGTVKEIIPQFGAIVETPACYIEGVFGVGKENYGELVILAKDPKQVIEEKDISKEHAEKILVCGAGITKKALEKADEYHVRGIIAGGIKNQDIVDMFGYEISSGITGQEEKEITIIATEGFGNVEMLPQTFELLKSHEGKLTSINGTTQIRAGVIRPEIIIPVEDAIVEQDKDEESMIEPKQGMKVRIISEPYYGKWGTIKSDGTQLKTLENGTKQEVVEIELASGEVVFVGENNVLVYEV